MSLIKNARWIILNINELWQDGIYSYCEVGGGEIKGEKGIKKLIRRIIPILLTVLFCFISMISLTTIIHMEGNARVINYTGIVRGATQRLVKLEMNQFPNDELISSLDGIISELSTGKGENGLIALPDPEYQRLLEDIQKAWDEIKSEIEHVRRNENKEPLFELSETYFKMTDQAVSAAERYSEEAVSRAKEMLICLSAGFVIVVILFWGYQQKQKKIKIALEMAESASRAKGEFLSRMSHEIRTPMNGIIGMTAIAQMSVDDRDKVVDCLKKIELSSSYLLALLNDILDMSRIESGRIELECKTFELPEVLKNIYGMLKQRAEENQVKFDINYDSVSVTAVIGDKLRISQVLVNIISNALKFTPPGGRVMMEVCQKAVTEQNVTLEFVITDTGIGISKEFKSRIFEPFEQEDSNTARQYGGTGLGLAISSNFVKMMGGEIIVHSKPNEGSQFIVRLTLPRSAQNESAEEDKTDILLEPDKQVPHNLTGIRVLLAEDNVINSEIVTVILEERGAQVESAFNGKEAVEKFAASSEGAYKLILMDIQMPVMSGLEASRAIRALDRPDAKGVFIIGVSANAFQEDIDKAMESGINSYMAKPIDIAKLLEVIGQCI